MSTRPPGRRTESLFDNRYRYDTIYPRGRSGETLRAYDTLDHDRPVVIKRPAPQDAPPMRAGQEVSIRTERQALERLSGHPVLTELRGSGTFRVGGNSHEYIVMDLARGQTVEEMVLAYAERGETLPDLEILVIMDNLLDLLAHAHDKQVIYNDVDAKHLFWNRSTYDLKVIDWGNAVFMDEPGALPAVSRATDIYQCGELLFFILTGGNRLAVQEDADTFFVNFGSHAERIPAKLQGIITRAVNPDPKRRYGTMLDLRHALTEVRLPLEKTRDEIIARLRKRVRSTASQEELAEIQTILSSALEMDPGHPEARSLGDEIQFYLRQIQIQADLDAVRIYLESANWPRALALLHELLPGVDEGNEPLIRFLIAATSQLDQLRISPPPAGFLDALTCLFQGDHAGAGQTLLTTHDTRQSARQAQWLLAEQLAVYVPDVVLLRPHLVRLRYDLEHQPKADPALNLLNEIEAHLSNSPLPGLTGLQVVYEQTADQLARLEEKLGPVDEQETTLAAVIRAQRAAHDVIERLDEVGNAAFADPSRAADLLRHAASIDPTSPYFAALTDYFDEIRQAIAALASFKPKADGTNLATWFADVQEFLQPYLDDLPDKQFHAAAASLRRAAEGWTMVINYLALGRQGPTIDALHNTADIIRPFNEPIAAWLGTMATRLPDAASPESLSPNTALATLLMDGWKIWDRGDGPGAAELGRKAHKQAKTDGERLAADRLRRLGDLLDGWLAENGPNDIERTDRAETEAVSILLADEEQERRTFAEQMPNTTLYLRAMSRGLVAHMHSSSSAGWRALYMHYVLRGTLALLTGDMEEADFWRNAALKTFEDGRTHRAFQVLDKALTGRRLVQSAETALNAVEGPNDLEAVRHAINAPLAGELLAGAEQAIQMIIEALRDWSDGDFHAARQLLDGALNHMKNAVETAHLNIDSFITWLTLLRDRAAELQQVRLQIDQTANAANDVPDPNLANAHRRIVNDTLEILGADYAHQVRQWDDMYQAVLDTYTTQRFNKREKLAAFSRHFSSLFISKHPAYPLFRHWEEVTEELPTDEDEDDVIAVEEAASPSIPDRSDGIAYLEDDQEPARGEAVSGADGDLPWNRIIIGAVILLIAAVLFGLWRLSSRDNTTPEEEPRAVSGEGPTAVFPSSTPRVTVLATQNPTVPATAPAVVVIEPSDTPLPATSTPTEHIPTLTPTESGPPTETPTLFITSTLLPTYTPVPTITPITQAAVLPASGPSDVLAALAAAPADSLTWGADVFYPNGDSTWTLSTASSTDKSTNLQIQPDLIAALFVPGAANTVSRIDATLELIDADPASLAAGEVAFGLGAQNAGGQRALGQVVFQESNVINLGLNQNGTFFSKTTTPQQNQQITLSVRRMDPTTLGFYVDDKSLGTSAYVFVQGQPLTLVLYVQGQNVTVKVSALQMEFNRRAELP